MYRPSASRFFAGKIGMRQTLAIATRMQTRQTHAISNPTLVDIEKRWEKIPPQEQANLWMALRDRMKSDWAELTFQEKKAGLYLLLML